MKRVPEADKPRYVMYASARLPTDSFVRQYVPIFTDLDYAKRWLMRLLHQHEWTRQGNWISTDSSLRVRCEHLDQVLAAPDSDEPLKPHDLQTLMQFKLGKSWEAHPDDSPKHRTAPAEQPEPASDNVPPVASKTAPKAVKASKSSVPDGYVTITELAATWGVKASDCRAMLRASDLVKPDYGWAFGPKEIDKIKKLCGVK